MGTGAGHFAEPPPGWLRPAVRAADHRHRDAGNDLRGRLFFALLACRSRTLSDADPAVHDGHARYGAVRQSGGDVRFLGSHQPAVVHADRFQFQPAGGAQGRPAVTGGNRRWRAGAVRRHPADRHHPGHFLAVGSGRACTGAAGQPAGRTGDDPDHARCLHQVGAAALPFLATPGDGGPGACLGLPALGDHGQAWRVSAGALRSGLWRDPGIRHHTGHRRQPDHAGGGGASTVHRWLQGSPGALHRGVAGGAGDADRSGWRLLGDRDDRLHHCARAVQGGPVLLRRHHHPCRGRGAP